MFRFSQTSYPVGIDISDTSIKLFQLTKVGDKIKTQAINKIDLAPGIVDEADIVKIDELVKAIKQLIATPKYGTITSREVVACLPENKTFTKLIELEQTPNDLTEMVKIEMEKHIPLPIEEIYYDWQIISTQNTKQSILLGAAPRTIVDAYTNLFDSCGLSLSALELESTAICRALIPEPKKGDKTNQQNTRYAILDIGAKRASLIFFAGQTVLFSVSLPFSSDEVTHKIAENLNISPEQAEKAKIICGLDETKAHGIVKEILAEAIIALIQKIKDTIAFYQSHFPKTGSIQQIYLCGGGSNIENLDKILEEKLGIKTSIATPLAQITDRPEKINKALTETYQLKLGLKNSDSNQELIATKHSELIFTTAIGLALRNIILDEM
ncbi:MAG: type IV pilus assembly protein PilM [Candidatus Falkowbacteria bacterium]